MDVHQALGGGSVADVLLWKKWYGGVVVLISATTMWFLFEVAGYNLLSFVANVLLLLVVILFFWAKAASLLNRPLPPIPDMEISEESVVKAADAIQVWINPALSIAQDIALRRNLKLFLKVSMGLCVLSFLGSLFNFLTLVFIGVLLSLSVPVVYDKYQDNINAKLSLACEIFQMQYRKIDDNLLKKIPVLSKQKKME